jgi:membrane associated rhomboid family serine protease
MIAWSRESDAEQPWGTWALGGLMLVVQLVAGGSYEAQSQLGVLPADPRLAALVGHLFVHSGMLHLLGTLFFAAAAGPWLEERLGRGLWLGAFLAAGLAGAALFVVAQPDAELPWLGGSAAVAGWLGLMAVSGRGESVDLLGVAAGRAGSLTAPAWAPAALWFGGQLANLLSGAAADLIVNVAGFGVGAGLALGFEKSGLIEAAAAPAPRAPGGTALRREQPARRTPNGPLPSGPLEHQLADSTDPRVAYTYLVRAKAEGRGDDGRSLVSERLFEAFDSRRREPAIALWCALVGAGATAAGPPEKLLQLASWVRAAGHTGEGAAALHAALAGADAAGAAKIARSARRSDPVICLRAAERALADPSLGESDKSALEGLRVEAEREVAARGFIVVPSSFVPPPAKASAPAAVRTPGARPAAAARSAAPQRALSLGEAIELAPEPEFVPPPAPLPDPERAGDAAFLDAFHAALHEEKPKQAGAPGLRPLRVREAVPSRLESDTLVLEVAERGVYRLPLTRIHAVALAGVRGISERAGDKPVLIVDLCLSAEGEAELHVLRLRSDRFDPRPLAPAPMESPLKALRAFVSALALAAHAPLLPADDVAGEGTLKIFRDLASYHKEVLGAA